MQQLIGLVACGGKSTRMGSDKCFLNYHGKAQCYFIYDMLVPLCNEVFISCNTKQTEKISSKYPILIDCNNFCEIGPMAALLSANERFPDASFLLIGCDYPLLETADIALLIAEREKRYSAVCYYDKAMDMEEPLLAIYENALMPALLKNYDAKKYSLRYLLKETNTKRVIPITKDRIVSIDSEIQLEKFPEIAGKLRKD